MHTRARRREYLCLQTLRTILMKPAICYFLAQHQVPLTHAQVFKKAASAEVLFAGFQNKDKIVQQIGKLPLSPDTCARRCDELSGDIFMQLMTKLLACPAFSLALGQNTDKSDTAQLMLMVSVRYYNEGVSDDFLCLIPLKGTTTARDVCSALLKFGEEYYWTWEHLVSLCTDGAPSMLGREAGFVALFRQEIGKPNLISYHFTSKHCARKQTVVCKI